MDEISQRKGYRHFITMVANAETGNLLEVIDSHQQEEIIEALKQQPLEIREKVEEVSVDMWAGFPKVIAEVFPNAVVVIDRFHVMKLVNQRLNKLRQIVGIKAQGSRFLLLKNSSDLTELETQKLEQILAQSPCLRIAYEMKEELREIYQTSQTVKTGLIRMKKWLATAIVLYGKVARTIRSHLEGICNYFISRTTSGVMEGINNKAKLIMRQGYGFTNFESFRARLLCSFSD
ncbi:MAG TPA: ISL3 family transposase [Cyanobacteria bacterium UBA11368]|nr:ISL3 family transposase [Cyanobacteria bacterium UBA11368]